MFLQRYTGMGALAQMEHTDEGLMALSSSSHFNLQTKYHFSLKSTHTWKFVLNIKMRNVDSACTNARMCFFYAVWLRLRGDRSKSLKMGHRPYGLIKTFYDTVKGWDTVQNAMTDRVMVNTRRGGGRLGNYIHKLVLLKHASSTLVKSRTVQVGWPKARKRQNRENVYFF